MTCRPCHVTTTREAHIAVTSLEIERRTPFEDGASFGDVGPYELLEGTTHFAVDPLSDVNTPITDIELAPRDADGTLIVTD